ncbi:MAG: CopG family transcriptional regulator [Proteobacteria bacterium]|nr:CopG family transcriptional regulator [Pseudomonadota bacterium]
MTTNLHVGLPDEMHAFIDMRANGENQDATPSEYVCALICEDVAREEDRRYAVRSLLKAEEEFRRGEMLPLSTLDAVDAELNEELG